MKRNTRTYKIQDKFYRKALRRGKGKLATLIEDWVTRFGNGADMSIFYNNEEDKKLNSAKILKQ